MGYPDAIGFRASTSVPFYWYDLEKDQETHLKIIPFCLMDVSLKNYMSLHTEAAIAKSAQLIETVQKVNGHFCLIWHNSSFDEKEWKGWKKVFEKIVSLAVKQGAHE